jgi:hypothetical protein
MSQVSKVLHCVGLVPRKVVQLFDYDNVDFSFRYRNQQGVKSLAALDSHAASSQVAEVV